MHHPVFELKSRGPCVNHYLNVRDCGVHKLICHWEKTKETQEPLSCWTLPSVLKLLRRIYDDWWPHDWLVLTRTEPTRRWSCWRNSLRVTTRTSSCRPRWGYTQTWHYLGWCVQMNCFHTDNQSHSNQPFPPICYLCAWRSYRPPLEIKSDEFCFQQTNINSQLWMQKPPWSCGRASAQSAGGPGLDAKLRHTKRH